MTEQLSVLEWAEERLANTLHIAPTKTGDDRAGWLEDAAYWSAIVDELRDVRRLRAELQAEAKKADALWQDVSEWVRLAKRQRAEWAGTHDADHGALCPTQAGIDKSERLLRPWRQATTPAQEGQ